MTTQRHPPRSRFVSDFPGVPAFRFFLVLVALFWPWVYLHGVARVAVGVPWSGVALLVAGLVVRARIGRTGR